jgi:hypothetical protein
VTSVAGQVDPFQQLLDVFERKLFSALARPKPDVVGHGAWKQMG